MMASFLSFLDFSFTIQFVNYDVHHSSTHVTTATCDIYSAPWFTTIVFPLGSS